jgi:hypothetical protein
VRGADKHRGWYKFLTAKTTSFYILSFYIVSILEGWEDIMDKTEIHQTLWFSFLTLLVAAKSRIVDEI